MPSRRELLVGGAAMAVLPASLLAKASQPATPVNFAVPANACDCHTHIHGDTKEFPMFAGRVYTPEPAMPEEMAQLDKTPESELDAMGRAGVRGIRLNLATGGGNDPSAGRQRLEKAAERMKARGWHVQMYTNLAVISAIKDAVLASPVPVVFDHFGGAQATLGLDQPGFADLLQLLKSGKAYVKISGAYRASQKAPDYIDAAPLARALIAANPERILWGTDWPHPNSVPTPGYGPMDVRPFTDIDDGRLLNQLPGWAPEASLRKTILVDNPARLYGFG